VKKKNKKNFFKIFKKKKNKYIAIKFFLDNIKFLQKNIMMAKQKAKEILLTSLTNK